MKYIHNSEYLNKLIGKKVKLTFTDGCVEVGILNIHERPYYPYAIDREGKGRLSFYKSHIKKIEAL